MSASHRGFSSTAVVLSAFVLGVLTGLSIASTGRTTQGHALADEQHGRRLREFAVAARPDAESACALERLLGLSEENSSRAAVAHLVSRLRSVRAKGTPLTSPAFTPLRQHPGSSSVLQDAFVRLHHLLFQVGWLPIHEWGARGFRNGSGSGCSGPACDGWLHEAYTVPFNQVNGHARPSVLARLAINGWTRAQGRRTSANSTCLGWDTVEYISPD
eukprot:3854221-Prymnesium_polylepis.1